MTTRKDKETGNRVYNSCCDIYQDTDRVVLKLEMPGVTKENLHIKVDGDLLIIKGKKREEEKKGNMQYHIREIRSGDFYHEFTLDETIDRNNIEASIKNGVVTLVLGIKEAVKPRKIEVKAG